MTNDPNMPPTSREHVRPTVTTPAPKSTSVSGWMLAIGVLAIVLVGAFLLWPSRTSTVAEREPVTTGTTPPAIIAPSPAPAAPSAPVSPDAPAQPTPAPAPTAPR